MLKPPTYYKSRGEAHYEALVELGKDYFNAYTLGAFNLAELEYRLVLAPLVRVDALSEKDAAHVMQGTCERVFYDDRDEAGNSVWRRARLPEDSTPLSLVTAYRPMFGWFALLVKQGFTDLVRVF